MKRGQITPEPQSRELRLLLLCARMDPTQADEAEIRQMLAAGTDWTAFARKLVDHGVASLVAHTLLRIASDALPAEIVDAFHTIIHETGTQSRAHFDELARIIEALDEVGLEAIPFKGPTLALEAFGSLELRMFKDLDLLVRDRDLARIITVLCEHGYALDEPLNSPQFELLQRIQGQDAVFNSALGITVEPHTRLTPANLVLDIDYRSLWDRATRKRLQGRTMLGFAPEDELIVLAIHAGKELWWKIKLACDFAAFVASHPTLDWGTALERARGQGCRRMLLLGAALARNFLGSALPAAVVEAVRSDGAIAHLVETVLAGWEADRGAGPARMRAISGARFRLHDGPLRQARYVARTLFLPGPQHAAAMPLPRPIQFMLVPLKLAHDGLALPLWRALKLGRTQVLRLREALAESGLALAVSSADSNAVVRRFRDACAEAERAVAETPGDWKAWTDLAEALTGLGQHRRAIVCCEKAIEIAPNNRALWRKRARMLRAAGRTNELPDAMAGEGVSAAAWTTRAGGLSYARRFIEAIDASDRALRLDPGNLAALRIGVHARLHSCDWRRREEDKESIKAALERGTCILVSSDHLALSDSEEQNHLTAQIVAQQYPPAAEPLWRGERYRHDKIRVAYISADFHAHATGFLIAGVFDHHDKSRFETIAISLGSDDGGGMRRRIEAAFDRFIDVRTMTDIEVARMLRDLEVDIAVDLKGYTAGMRPRILAYRPAPAQVSYLGHPGTMGASYIDYLIADRVVIPEDQQIHYTEKVVYLPNSYQANDSKREIPAEAPSRAAARLPENAFVFASLNNPYKLSPEVFDVWMRLLRKVDRAVLWQLEDNAGVTHNLRREARARGIAPERLVFAPRVPPDFHLARQMTADLFLDTLPVNAHTTASDALWAGLPVLTCLGKTFAGRVAASLNYAVGLPELVTSSLDEYEETALNLALDPERLAAIKARLLHNRRTAPLFDTASFTRDLESAFETMWERSQAALPPAGFAVPASR